MAGKRGMKQYPLELKLEALQMFYEEVKTRKDLLMKHNIGSSSDTGESTK